jgi:ferredoxin
MNKQQNEKTTGIYYFSGTGNSFAAAKQIAAKMENCSVISITQSLLDEKKPIVYDAVIVVYPSYAYGMPAILYSFFKIMDFRTEYLALIVTHGTKYGATLSHAKCILKKRGRTAQFYGNVQCVENYIPIFGLAKDAVLKQKIESQREKTQVVAEAVQSRQTNDIKTFKPFSRFVSGLFRSATPLFAKTYRFTKRCTNCGICAEICPSKAIEMRENKRPKVHARKCQHCQACLNWCPFNAINYVRIHKNSRRYHHPDITLNEMKKNNQ